MPFSGIDLLVTASAGFAALFTYLFLCRTLWPGQEAAAAVPWHHYLLDEDMRQDDLADINHSFRQSIPLYGISGAAFWAMLIFLLSART